MTKANGLVAIHIAVALMGGAGLFAKFLQLSPSFIVCVRTLIASVSLAIILHTMREPIKPQKKCDLFAFLLMGLLLAIHWITFFHSIQISTVAIGLLSYSTFPIFVTFLEPLFSKVLPTTEDILTAFIVFFGLFLVIPDINLKDNITMGAFWGTISGLTFALLSILNRRYVSRYSPLTLAFYQDLVVCFLLLPFLSVASFEISTKDWFLLIILGVIFTAGAHSCFIKGMTVVRAQTASIIACLEPIYAIIFAILLLSEIPSFRELLGGVVILGTVAYTTIKVRGRKRSSI